MKKLWQWFKLGVPPLIITFIVKYASCWIWNGKDNWGLHLVNNLFLDIPITAIIIFFSGCLYGYLVSREWFEKFAKEYLLVIPVIGWLVVCILPKGNLKLIEVRTTWGPTLEESCWEYALETRDPWLEDGVIWHRAHTLGWTGKLFCSVGDGNIREISVPQHKAWITILSLGLL